MRASTKPTPRRASRCSNGGAALLQEVEKTKSSKSRPSRATSRRASCVPSLPNIGAPSDARRAQLESKLSQVPRGQSKVDPPVSHTVLAADVVACQQVEKVKRAFSTFDADGNGKISRAELGQLLMKLGDFTELEVDRIMNAVDKDLSGEIDYDEFLSWTTAPVNGLATATATAGLCLESALRPLFKIFARQDTGVISRANFRDCYAILSGALKALPGDSVPTVTALVTSEEDRIFGIADKNQDNELSYAEFVEWQREALSHSGITRTQLVELVQQLSSLLEGVFLLTERKKWADTDHMFEDPILRSIMPKVADCSRELWRRSVNSCKESHGSLKWPKQPAALSMQQLMRKHLQEPVPTVNVDKIDVKIHCCVPDLAEDGDSNDYGMAPAGQGHEEEPRWLAKVMRHITYVGGGLEILHYYYEYRESWYMLPQKEEFFIAMAVLPPELQLYAFLLTEADFGSTIQWPKIQSVLEDAQKSGIITAEEHLEYNLAVEKSMMRALEKESLAKHKGHNYEKRKELLADLLPKAAFSPVEVMQALTACGVTPVHPAWGQ